MQGTDFIEDIEPFFQHPAHVALLHHRNIAAVGDFAQEARAAANVLFQQAVDSFQLLGLLTVLHIIEQLIIAVDNDDKTRRAAGVVLIECFLIEGIVDKVYKAGSTAALGGGRVGGEAPFPHGQILPMGAGADSQVKLWQNARYRAGHGVIIAENLLFEMLVVPQDAAIVDKNGRNRQVGKAVLDTAVFKLGAAQLFSQKGAQTAALVEHHAKCNEHQHRRHSEQLRPDERHRHDHNGDGGQQQQQYGGYIQTILVFHCTFLSSKAFTLPAGSAESSGCAWCGGRYSWTAPPARVP